MLSLSDAVGRTIDDPVVVTRPVRGGDEALAHQMTTASGRTLFVKTHEAPPPGFFTTEAAGLRWLAAADAGAVAVAPVVAVSDGAWPAAGEAPTGGPAFLALTWIEAGRGPRDDAGEAAFGRGLARLHRHGAEGFGRTDHRTTGSLAMPNEPAPDWATFYAERRLAHLARIATDRRALPPRALAHLDRLDADRLRAVGGPPERAARLHGDLWAGNRIVDRSQRSWLIDPASYGGHREADLAMMRLFGGFGGAAFVAYHEEHPLAPGWEERVELHQLAPLLVHAIRFGSSYVPATEAALARYA